MHDGDGVMEEMRCVLDSVQAIKVRKRLVREIGQLVTDFEFLADVTVKQVLLLNFAEQHRIQVCAALDDVERCVSGDYNGWIKVFAVLLCRTDPCVSRKDMGKVLSAFFVQKL